MSNKLFLRMKKFLFFTMVALFMMAFCSCSKDDGEGLAGDETNNLSGLSSEADELNKANENSTNPEERIVGSWLLVRYNEDDVSSQNKGYTFMEDRTWTASPPLPSGESNPDHQVVTFEDGWVYDAEKDVISGYLDLHSPSTEQFPYRFEMKRKELVLSYEPRELYYCMPPSPMVWYYIRK